MGIDDTLYNDVDGGQAPSSLAQGMTSAQPQGVQPDPSQVTAQVQQQAQPNAPPAGDVSLPDQQGQPDTSSFNQPQPMVRFQRTVGNTLKGMLIGMLDGGVGGAIAGGVSPTGAQRVADQQASLASSKVKFASAQAASMAADASMRDKQLHSYDEDHQNVLTNQALSQMTAMKNMGIAPSLVVDNNKGGGAAMTGLQQLTDTHGAVPPLFTINLGNKIVAYDLGQLTQAPQTLTEVNKVRQMTGQTALTPQAWAQLPDATKMQQTNFAFGFSNPMPSESTLTSYKNYLATAEAAPDSPDKQSNVAKLQGMVDSMQKVLDESQARATKQDVTAKNAEIRGTTGAEAARAGAIAGAEAHAKAQYDQKPVYAVNSNGDTVLTTSAAAQQGGMSAIRAVKEGDISKDQHDIKVLSDIQTKANNVQQTAGAMDNTGWAQTAIAAKYLADNPNTPLNTLFKSAALKNATPAVKNYIVAINSLRESSMGLQKVLTGTARTNETQLSALLNTLPGVEPNSGLVKQKLGAFTQNLQLLAQGLPKGTGVELQGFGGQQQQTIYASAPGKPRVMSQDGGKTWQPAM